jgi:hypothetical protein
MDPESRRWGRKRGRAAGLEFQRGSVTRTHVPEDQRLSLHNLLL